MYEFLKDIPPEQRIEGQSDIDLGAISKKKEGIIALESFNEIIHDFLLSEFCEYIG